MNLLHAVVSMMLAVTAVGEKPVASSSPGSEAWYSARSEAYTVYKAKHAHAWRDVSRSFAKTGSPIELWDGAAFPQMVAVPAGEFIMGSSPSEPNRRADEGPAHLVQIGYAMAVGKFPISVAEYGRFVSEAGYKPVEVCKTFEAGAWQEREGRSWLNPGYPQTINDPVVCINWNDAQAYVAWLAKTTGRPYRLLSSAEYEYVNRAGTQTPYWWGADIGGDHANCNACGNAVDYKTTIPVGGFAPNPFGLYDTTGNAWSWVSDCLQEDYTGLASDGSPSSSGDCGKHVLRGGAWFYVPGNLRSAIHTKDETTLRNYHNGFRVALTLKDKS
jgi:formylglycine-generating enzyme required for sulfatase activity